MKTNLTIFALFLAITAFSQEHFAGLANSSRIGIITADINPAELNNLGNKFEVNAFGASVNIANNKISFKDLTKSSDELNKQLFSGTEPVNLRVNAAILGPSFAYKMDKWAFAITSKANIKFDLIDVDTKLADGLSNGSLGSLVGSSSLSSSYNQRLNGISYGEIGLSLSRTILNSDKQKFNVGATLKLLFPGSYTNLGLDKFSGTISNSGGQVYLNNTVANLNLTYSGNLSNGFSNFSDYSKSVFGGLNGYAVDLGVNYQIKDEVDSKNKNKYKFNFGAAVRNIGSMTFKDDSNYNKNYALKIQSTTANPLGLNLNQFENVNNVNDIEAILVSKGYLTIQNSSKDFKVKLPTLFSAYADVKIISKVFVSGYIQQKLTSDGNNDQISNPNVFTLTPRYNTGFFEAFLPVSNSSVSGVSTGFGFRLAGFYLGSGSALSALINNSKQADFYVGYRASFL